MTSVRVSALRLGATALAVVMAAAGCEAFAPGFGEFGGERVRDPRDRAAQQDAMLELRLDMLLPQAMEAAVVDCWLVVSDGHGGDPAVDALTLSTTRLEGKGALLLCREGNGLRRFAFGRGLAANAAIYDVAEPSAEVSLEDLLNERLLAAGPQRIAINDAHSFAAADGLSASNERWLRERLHPDLAERLVSSRPLVEDFLSTQLDVESTLFAESARFMAAILEEVLSDQVVVAAGTSLADLDWAVRERAARIDVELVYPPSTLVYRPGATLEAERAMGLDLILQPGDLVFLSAGISHLGYSNRVGRWAYLLPSGERVAPDWVGTALNQLADAAQRVVDSIAIGHNDADVRSATSGALAGLADARAAVDRVARLREGAVNPSREVVSSGTWRSDFRLAADTGLAITVEATFTAPGAVLESFSLLLVDTAVVGATGSRFVGTLQRLPLLID
jgi:hypothetical protein